VSTSSKSGFVPQKRITFPAPIAVIHPLTGTKTDQVITFRSFIEQVFQNPIWNGSYQSARAQRSISDAAQSAEEKKETTFVISEEDWKILEQAVRDPKIAMANGEVVPGFGYQPTFARQILPMQEAVIQAESF